MSDQRIPSSWVRARVGDLCTLINGRAFKPTDWSNEGLPIIRIQNLNNPTSKYNYYDKEVEEKFYVSPGELLFAWSGTPGTSFGAHIWSGERAILNQHIFRVLIDEDLLDKAFIRYALNNALDGIIDQSHGGVGLGHITKGKFEDTRLLIPPSNEQRRIVAKIDALLARIRRARDEVKAVPALVEQFRQAALGRLFALTDQARRSLHSLVDAERGITYGIVQTGEHTESGVPTVRCGDIKEFNIGISQLKKVDALIESNYKRTRIQGGEVLIAIRGTVGATAVATEHMQGMNISREVALIPVSREVVPEYLMYLLVSPEISQILGGYIKGVAQSGINIADLKNLEVPVPPIDEQREIVRRVKALFSRADALSAEVKAARERLDVLEQAVLAKAFRGELVPQDPRDEPASVLLERIRAQRAEGDATRSLRKRGRAAQD